MAKHASAWSAGSWYGKYMNVFVIVLVTVVPLALWLLWRARQHGSSAVEKDIPIADPAICDEPVATGPESGRGLRQFEESVKEPDAEAERGEEALASAETQNGEIAERAGDNSVQENSAISVELPRGAEAISDAEQSGGGQNELMQSNGGASVLAPENVMEPSVPGEPPEKLEIGNEENAEIDETPALGRRKETKSVVARYESSLLPAEGFVEGISESSAEAQEPRTQIEEHGSFENAEIVPPRYRSPRQTPPRQSGPMAPENKIKGTEAAQAAPMEIRVRLAFDRFGFVSLGFLPVRSLGLDEEIEATDGRVDVCLVAQENWYQDLQFSDAGERLRQGVELKGVLSDGRRVRWRLSGRDIYVLAAHPHANGFVSTGRLLLGRRDVVLCTNELVAEVEAALAEAGCQGYTKFSEAQGLSREWTGFRGVLPVRAVALGLGNDLLYAVKPSPEIQIELEGGICVRNSVWLAGYPPQIKLLGETHGVARVLIDGRDAQHTPEGGLTVAGYDLAGAHSVYCEGLSCSRTYSIEEPEESWEQWAAYSFSEADVCGPLAQMRADAFRKVQFSVPMSNPLLLGAEAGQVFQCSSRRTTNWTGFVPFDVVWALPTQPLRCDKKTARILQFSSERAVLPERPAKSEFRWSNAILDAGRKGLRIDNGSADSLACWVEYKKAARNIRRGRR